MKENLSESKNVAMQKNKMTYSRNTEMMDVFYSDIRKIIETSRGNAVRSIDFCRVQIYLNMG